MISTELGYAISLALIALVVLILSASKGVEKVLALSHHYGIDATFVGLTIFSITTSFPEIFAHLTASVNILAGTMNYKVVSGTVLGANIGSDVIQQTLILGIIVLYQRSLVFTKDFLLSAYLPMIGTTLMCILLGWDGIYSRLDGIILFGTFLLYMIFLYKKEQHLHHAYSFHPAGEINIHKNVIIALLCMFLMFISAHFLLLATETVVSLTGLGASLIGVITIGVVSAAPELFTAFSGIRQHEIGISIGTLIGSNIINPLVAIGSGAMISTYWVPRPLIYWDLAMETITALLLLLYLFLKKEQGKLGRLGGLYLIALYFFYVYIRIRYFPTDF